MCGRGGAPGSLSRQVAGPGTRHMGQECCHTSEFDGITSLLPSPSPSRWPGASCRTRKRNAAHPLSPTAQYSELSARSASAASGVPRQLVGWEKLPLKAPAALGSVLVLCAYATWRSLQIVAAAMENRICCRVACLSREVGTRGVSWCWSRVPSELDQQVVRQARGGHQGRSCRSYRVVSAPEKRWTQARS